MQQLDMLLEPVHGFLLQLGAFMPRLAIALACSSSAGCSPRRALQRREGAARAQLPRAERARGVDNFLQQGGTEKDTTDLIGWIVYALAILLSLIVASTASD